MIKIFDEIGLFLEKRKYQYKKNSIVIIDWSRVQIFHQLNILIAILFF